MTAVFLHTKAELRARWRSWLLLAVLVAVAGGAVVALAAGARRTDSAYPRFLHAQRAADMIIYVDPRVAARAEHFPAVADSATLVGLVPTEPDLVPVVLADGRFGRQLNRFKYLAGRPLNPDRADEVVVGFLLARSRHLHVGSFLTIGIRSRPATPGPGLGPPPSAQAVTFRVVGIEATPGEFPPRSNAGNLPAYLSPAFLRTAVGAQVPTKEGAIAAVAVRLRHGVRDVIAFQKDVQALGGPIGSSVQADQSASVQRSMHLQAVALWLMAGFAGLATALVLLQLLARQRVEDSVDDATFRSLGMTSGQLLASGMVRVGTMAVVGATGAVIVAVLLSPLPPLGTARVAEPHPGFAFDFPALVLGAAGALVLVTLLGAGALVRTTRTLVSGSEPIRDRPSAIAQALTLARLPLVVATGLRLALQSGRGRTAVPVRATLAAAAIGIGAMAAAVTFGASLGHLLATPGLYGVTFDARIEGNGNFSDISGVVPVLKADPTVEAVAIGTTGLPLNVGKITFGAQATSDVEGSLRATVVEGRLPAGPDEILFGTRTMGDLHAHIGQTVPVAVTGITGPIPMRVVGRGVLAPISDTEQLGLGAIVAQSALPAFLGAVRVPGFTPPGPGDVFVRFRPGVNQAAAIAALQRRLLTTVDVSVVAPTQPTDVVNFGQVRDLPQLLAGLLGVVAAVTMAYLLVSSIRRRRRDLAILKTLGFVPLQVSMALAWQATAVVLLATLVGLPLGLAAGRSAWAVAAGQVGVVVRPTVPWAFVLGLAPLALLIANLVAAGPALVAGRIRPASVLRSE